MFRIVKAILIYHHNKPVDFSLAAALESVNSKAFI
jgi:hypothetical protein